MSPPRRKLSLAEVSEIRSYVLRTSRAAAARAFKSSPYTIDLLVWPGHFHRADVLARVFAAVRA